MITKKVLINQLAEKNNGILAVSEMMKLGISKQYCMFFLKQNGYERAARGVYLSQDAFNDDFYIICRQYKQAVFSHESALYLLGLAERTPIHYTVTVPHGYRTNVFRQKGIEVYTSNNERYSIGLIEIQTPNNHTVLCYDAERTLCDIFRTETDPQDKQNAVIEYLRERKNITKLMKYAEVFHVDERILKYMEVIL